MMLRTFHIFPSILGWGVMRIAGSDRLYIPLYIEMHHEILDIFHVGVQDTTRIRFYQY